jgi:hypothetical protein
MRFGIVIGWLCCLVSSAFAQEKGNLVLTGKPDKIRIGEHVNLQVKLEKSPQAALTWIPYETCMEGTGLEMVEEKTPVKKSATEELRELTITAFDSGTFTIPAVKVILNGDTLQSNTLSLVVSTVEVDTTAKIFDIKSAIEEPATWADFWNRIWYWIKSNWLLLSLFALILLGVITYFILEKRKKSLPPPPPPPVPAHIIAYGKLKEVEESKLVESADAKTFYSVVSEIIREYIENRFDVPALEQTTEELLMAMRNKDLPEDAAKQLTSMLRFSDLVKFAKEEPDEFEKNRLLRYAWDFVDLTKYKNENPTSEN